MSGNHSRVLEECRVQLVKDLEPDDVMDYLLADGILVPDDQEKIVSMRSRKEKVRYLLDLIPRRGDKAVLSFMKALEDRDSGHNHLYEMIQAKLREQQHLLGRSAPQYSEQCAEPGKPMQCTETDMPADCIDASPGACSMPHQSQKPGFDFTERLRDTPRSPGMMPTDKHLSQLASNMGKDWEQLAVGLGLSQSDIYKCKMEHQFNLWGQINSALIKWRNREYKKATIGKLVKELDECDIGREVYEFLMNA